LPPARRAARNAGADSEGMTSAFTVRMTPRYQRLSNKLQKGHRDFEAIEKSAAAILSADPYNRARRHHIKKLEGVSSGDGQYRLSLGRWRFRYDIVGWTVPLHYCGLRREDTY
jgi:hypothetical protein